MTKPREKTREELTAEIEDGKEKIAGKREDSEEIKLRLYDRLPYGVMLGVTMLADFMVFPAGFFSYTSG